MPAPSKKPVQSQTTKGQSGESPAGAALTGQGQSPGVLSGSAVGRQSKRKQNTRMKLLGAALRLMTERGVAGVAIQDITNAADVGFGSFYNHFPSKEAIHQSLKDELIEHYAAALDQLGGQVLDPAEKVAASARYTIKQARSDQLWGRFVLATSFNTESLTSGLGRFLLRDLQAGIQQKRFTCHHLPSLVVAVGSTILGGVMVASSTDQTSASTLGPTDDLAEKVSATMLTLLGISWQEANEIANRPLPAVQLPIHPFIV